MLEALSSGEHIDYALFGVFPAAIERDILIAVAPRDEAEPGHVTAENSENKYSRQTFGPIKNDLNEWTLDIDKTQLRWESYVKAGYYVQSLSPVERSSAADSNLFRAFLNASSKTKMLSLKVSIF